MPPTNRQNAERLRGRYKVRMCIYYLAGGCTEGANCTFAHSPEELANPKTVMCPAGANCVDPNCPFAHDRNELVVGHQRVIQQTCKYIAPGYRGCNAGDCCRFAHTRDELLTGVRNRASNLLGDAGMVNHVHHPPTSGQSESTSQLTPEHAHPDLITKDRVREAAKALGLVSHDVSTTTNCDGEIVWQLTTEQLLKLIKIASGGQLPVDDSSVGSSTE